MKRKLASVLSPLPSVLHSLYPILRDVYGELRGYRRWSIRKLVSEGAELSDIRERYRRLAEKRYHYTVTHFPAYEQMLKSSSNYSDVYKIPFESLPILSKNDVTKILFPEDPSLSPFPPVQKRIPHATGGSTGKPFKFYITRESYEWRTAVSDRGYSWAQAEEGQRSFYVWGTAIDKPGWRQRIKEGVHHWLQNRRYFDSFHFDDERKLECCRQINRFKPVSIVGYAGNLIELARYVRQNSGALQWRAKTAVTAAEGLRPGMRELIEEYLADEVFMSYGSREFMLIGMEGPDHDGYYLSADNLYVEVVDDDGKPCKPGETGRIVVTDLHNDATPFVRYAIGDVGRVFEQEATKGTKVREIKNSVLSVSSCSNIHLPRLAAVEGRLQEVIVRADGEKLTALFIPHLMKEFDWVDGYQVVQAAPGCITVCLQTDDSDWETKSEAIRQKLLERLGDETEIRFEVVRQFQKTSSGKTPIVVGGRGWGVDGGQ